MSTGRTCSECGNFCMPPDGPCDCSPDCSITIRKNLLENVTRWHDAYLRAKRERAVAVAKAREFGLLFREIGEPIGVNPGTMNGIYQYAQAKGLTS